MLQGAHRVMKEAGPALFLALHGQEQRQECEVLLRDAGYGLYALDGSRFDGPILTDGIVVVPRGSASARNLAARSKTNLPAHRPS